ncbi:MAG: hypothetical protein ACI35S_06130 [Anaeroplasma sp.]
MDKIMDIFEDYEAWKAENLNLITTLVKKQSNTISRFTAVIAVVDYLYYENKKRKLSDDEELIFSTGFDYIYDQFHYIATLLEMNFDNNIDEMEKYSQTINLLLYINEFQSEVLNLQDIKKDIKLLDDLEQKVNVYLENKENAPDEFFALLDDITNKIFEQNNIEIQTVEQIFYEIAIEYGIYPDNEFDIYNNIINQQISKTRNVVS